MQRYYKAHFALWYNGNDVKNIFYHNSLQSLYLEVGL